MSKKKLQGKVISDKMKKTIVVEARRAIYHPKYKKRYFISKKYKAHDEKELYKTGDEVLIEESSPVSREKKWQVVKKIK